MSSIVSNLTEANSGSLREPVEHLANICFARRRESAREILARATDVLPHLRLRILRNERLPPIEKSLRPEQRNKSFTVPPYQKQLEGGKHECRWKTFRRHERMKDQDVDDDCAENRQSQRDEAPNQEK